MGTNVYDIVTNRIILELENGVVPWVRPWTGGKAGSGLPYNAVSNNNYSGINIPLCWMTPFERQGWVTYKQAQKLGGNVIKGQKGTMIVFAKSYEGGEADADGKRQKFFVHRGYSVFNLEQCEGLPATLYEQPEPVTEPIACVATQYFIQSTLADIRHGGMKAFYRRDPADYIQVPDAAKFTSMPSYYATVLHELTHWTGAKSRLDRIKGKNKGDDQYAKEELIAELGAAYLCAGLGIKAKLQHASYIASWLKALKDDRKLIFMAASQASKAVGYLNGLGDTPDTANTTTTGQM